MKHVLGIFLLLQVFLSQAQTSTIKGTVTDASDNSPIPGVNVIIKGTSIGTITAVDGTYSLKADVGQILTFSFIGMESMEVKIESTVINVALESSTSSIDEVVIVGYGVQTKESVVGSIVQTSGETLMQSGGVSNIGQALTGRLPGVTTISSTGRPGDESPEIFIRGQSTWNGDGQPLILIDGIPRSMNDIDPGEVENVSVLKDASATAVYGVKGGNGVILITTKRGSKGKPQLSVTASSTFKQPSKLPQKYDAYNGFRVMNEAIERSLPINEGAWLHFQPYEIMERYRNPSSVQERETYPDVDWVDATQKDFVMDHRANLSVRGGGNVAKYFGSISYQHVGDIFDGARYDNGRGYQANYNYNRFNYRSNVDFDITKSTRLSVNLSGYYGVQNGNEVDQQLLYGSIYELPPSIFYPMFEDGTYGRTVISNFNTTNPAMLLSAKGATRSHRIQVNSDFILEQKLDFLLKGLSIKGSLSYDNNFRGKGGVKEDNPYGSENVIYRIYNSDGTYTLKAPDGTNQFDYVTKPWTYQGLTIEEWSEEQQTERRLFYQFALNYARTFAEKHNTTLLFLMNREEYAKGHEFPHYREDWVSRVTYNYNSKYFLDVNGAYNGSEKFGTGYTFDLFPSVAIGWMISNEWFMKSAEWLDKLKVRGSWGLVGDDAAGDRWAYVDQWSSGGKAIMDNNNVWNRSPYVFYKEDVIGNPDIHWENSEKTNVGLELSILKGTIKAEVDYFYENRTDIIVEGKDRSVPSFYGFEPASANVGETEVKGLEVMVGFRKKVGPNLTLWADASFTKAKDKIILREDPELRQDYQKKEGYAIGQPTETIRGDLMTSWDDVYGSGRQELNQGDRRPGYYDEIDFNSDGIINVDDKAPYGYPVRPQNTYNLTLGADYNHWNFMIQFYGVSNAHKKYVDRTFAGEYPLFFEFKEDYWSVENQDGKEILPSFAGASGGTDSYRQWYDASFLRLKNIELGYQWKARKGSQYKVYVSGNDLFFWSDLPDDRQNNITDNDYYRGNYPTFKRLNVGVNINF